ncbi:hypothetical protein HDV05_003043 [Chytridiales sp. JEL 0842]|nr:hypothetical protein HDV05_003043 [Chytridiales sp. JEL 0842]
MEQSDTSTSACNPSAEQPPHSLHRCAFQYDEGHSCSRLVPISQCAYISPSSNTACTNRQCSTFCSSHAIQCAYIDTDNNRCQRRQDQFVCSEHQQQQTHVSLSLPALLLGTNTPITASTIFDLLSTTSAVQTSIASSPADTRTSNPTTTSIRDITPDIQTSIPTITPNLIPSTSAIQTSSPTTTAPDIQTSMPTATPDTQTSIPTTTADIQTSTPTITTGTNTPRQLPIGRRRYRSYTLAFKSEAVALAKEVGRNKAAGLLSIPRILLSNWRKKEELIKNSVKLSITSSTSKRLPQGFSSVYYHYKANDMLSNTTTTTTQPEPSEVMNDEGDAEADDEEIEMIGDAEADDAKAEMVIPDDVPDMKSDLFKFRAKHPEEEKVVLEWIMKKQAAGEIISSAAVRRMMYALVSKTTPGFQSFNASVSWLHHFVKRHKLKLMTRKPPKRKKSVKTDSKEEKES